ncbi:MAG: helix-turn-helix transcriptional regulator [Deltaproteobacteria bacterium]|nr:helix-turn-helix transcriptional regulator [Deltaproteobacteria bacterium]
MTYSTAPLAGPLWPSGASRPAGLHDEVSSRVPFTMLAELPRRGVSIPRLLQGLPFTREELLDPQRRVGWDDFVVFLERVRDALGGPMELADFCGNTLQLAPQIRAIGSLVVSPRRLYLSVAERIGRSLFHNIAARVGELPDGRVWQELQIPESYCDSTAFFYLSLGALKAFPRAVGAPEAEVEMELTPHRALFLITPPESRTLASRAAQLLRTPLEWMSRARLAGVEPTQEHLLEGVELAFGEGYEYERASAGGEQLAAAHELTELARRFSASLEETFGSGHLVLWARTPAGSWLDPVTVPAERHSHFAPRTLPVCFDGRELGRVELDVPQLALGASVPLLTSVLPWLALGLVRCLPGDSHASVATAHVSSRPAAAPGARADDAARAWGLSRRQTEVLHLLASGCSNKDIAQALGASVKTIEAHVSEILRKAGVDGRAALVALVWSSQS